MFYKVHYRVSEITWSANIAIAESVEDVKVYYEKKALNGDVMVNEAAEHEVKAAQRRGMPVVSVPAAKQEEEKKEEEKKEEAKQEEEKKVAGGGYDLTPLYEAMREARERLAEHIASGGDPADFLHLPRSNAKLGTIAAWNLLPVLTCGGHKCQGCYAVKNALCHGSNYDKNACLRAWAENTAFLLWCEAEGDYQPFIDAMTEYFGGYLLPYFRIHASGDFFSEAYFDAWNVIAGRFTRTKFMAFTKQYSIAMHSCNNGTLAANFVVIVSAWPGVELPECIGDYFPIAWVDAPGESRITEKAIACGGNCSRCNEGAPLCWFLRELRADVKFKKH